MSDEQRAHWTTRAIVFWVGAVLVVNNAPPVCLVLLLCATVCYAIARWPK